MDPPPERIFPPPIFYRPKSTSFPALEGNPSIWAFTQQVTKDIQATDWKRSTGRSNLKPALHRALSSLKHNDHIVIKPLDKGGNIVVIIRDFYKKMVLDLLQNRSWYRPIPSFQVKYAETKFKILVSRAFHNDLIYKKTFDLLTVETPRTPTLYALPKVHKHLKFPPGRPIVSGNGCLTEPASKLVDDY